jgi:hypothetical protein
MASSRYFSLAGTTTFLALLLIASTSRAQPADSSPAKVFKQTFNNGASRYVFYQVTPDAPPHTQALYSALGQAENDKYLSDQLQQLLLEYTEQERMLGSVRTSRELNGYPPGSYGYTSPDGVTKAYTVQGLVCAAEARSRFAGLVNRELELLEQEAAGNGNAGGMSARDAVREEPVALEKQREEVQQAASRPEEEASMLVEQAKQMEKQAAERKQTWTAIQRVLRPSGLLTVSNSAAAGAVLESPLSVVSSPVAVPPHRPAAEQGVSARSWVVAGLCALGTLLLIGFGMPLLRHYRRLAFSLAVATSRSSLHMS